MNKSCDIGFVLDERLASSCTFLLDWPLSRVLIKNHADYPWFILVPRRLSLIQITDLNREERFQLMDEIDQLSRITKSFFQVEKVNLGALGHIVPQFHFHVVGRVTGDPLWPHSVWQAANIEVPYHYPTAMIENLKEILFDFCINHAGKL